MKLLTISLVSLAIGLFLGWSSIKTAEQIAKATMPRIEMLP
jgi:hypothetical protein